jgi:integrase/recombinase XerC
MQELFTRYLNYLEAEKHASPYTVRNYRNDLVGNIKGVEKGFFQFLRMRKVDSLEAVDRRLVRDYLGYLLEQKIAKVSLARKLSAIRSFYRYMLREGIIAVNTVEEVASPRLDKHLPEFLTTEEVTRLINAPNLTKPLGLRDRAIIELIYAAGLRVSEMGSLDLGSLDLDDRTLRVWGKGNKERIVVIGQPAADALSQYIREVRPKLAGKVPTPALFLNYDGGRLTQRWVQKLILKYAAQAGIGKRVHPHVLRHTFATHMLDGGADLRVVQDLLGHANLGTTQIYTHVTQSQARKVYMASHPGARIANLEGNKDGNEHTA